MNHESYIKIIYFLIDDIGLDQDSLELGIRLAIKKNTPLPVLLWNYGILTIEELDDLYTFLFKKT